MVVKYRKCNAFYRLFKKHPNASLIIGAPVMPDYSLSEKERVITRNKKIYENPSIDTENKTISIELSQEDTLNYEIGNINLQVKIKLDSGRVIASRIITTSMNKILEEQIL